jgi:iron(III) transport system substrate-binding protein
MTRFAAALLLAAFTAALPARTSAVTELTVYTALEADQLRAYAGAFEAANPDVKINWVRDSTGIVTAKLLAEKANPQADVVMGLAATSLMLLDKEKLLAGYAPKGLEALKPSMRDPANPPRWVGMDIWASVICFNTVEAKKRNIPAPTSWADLARPEYQGQVVMPNPASSGTGFLMVSGWLQMMGADKAWTFMDGLDKNIAAYTHSGSKPCKQAAAGEFVVGLSFDYRGNASKRDGAPIDVILPKEGLGWDMEASGIIVTTKKMDAARKLLDWSVTREANELYAKNFAVVAIPGVQHKLEFIAGDVEAQLARNDFAKAASQRDTILAEWTKRYDGKSEPKKK